MCFTLIFCSRQSVDSLLKDKNDKDPSRGAVERGKV